MRTAVGERKAVAVEGHNISNVAISNGTARVAGKLHRSAADRLLAGVDTRIGRIQKQFSSRTVSERE